MPRVVDGGKLAVQHTSFGINDSNNPGNNHTPNGNCNRNTNNIRNIRVDRGSEQ